MGQGDGARIALVKPPSCCVQDDRLEPPLGLLYLGAAARAAGFEDIVLADLSGCDDEQTVQARLEQVPEADVYAISAFCTNHGQALQVAARARQLAPRCHVVMGGPNPSAMPELTLQDENVDAVVVGEGEDALVQCLRDHQTGRPRRGIVSGRPREKLDGLAFPARDLVDQASYSRHLLGRPVASLISSRGCRQRCAFCNSVVMGGGSRGVRFRSPGNLIEELRGLRGEFDCFRFNDDNFTAHPRLLVLLERLAELRINFRIFARVEELTPETCAALHRAGCVHVSVGLESMDPRNLAQLGKGRQAGHESNVKVARDAGLTVRSFFLVGLPHDSDDNIERCFNEAAKLGLHEATVYPLLPYPGTDIARDPQRFGYEVVDHDFTRYVQIGRGGRSYYPLKHEHFDPVDVERWKHLGEQILEGRGVIASGRSSVTV